MHIELFLIITVFFCLLDFGIHMIYEPAVNDNIFITVIICMAKIVTILAQFLALYFIIIKQKSNKIVGFGSSFRPFISITITGGIYLFFFIINIIILLNRVLDQLKFDTLWEDYTLITFWSIQRLCACVHYTFTFFVLIKVVINPRQYL